VEKGFTKYREMLYRIRKKASWNMVKSLTGYGKKYYSIRENALKNTEKINRKKPFFSAFCGI